MKRVYEQKKKRKETQRTHLQHLQTQMYFLCRQTRVFWFGFLLTFVARGVPEEVSGFSKVASAVLVVVGFSVMSLMDSLDHFIAPHYA